MKIPLELLDLEENSVEWMEGIKGTSSMKEPEYVRRLTDK